MSSPQLPFIQGSLRDIGDSAGKVFDVAQPLLVFIQQQTRATIVCGTIDAPSAGVPTGPSSNLPAGTTLHCRALTVDSGISNVNWPDADTNETDSNTVGIAPMVSAIFDDVSGRPDISVTFTGPACGDPETPSCGGPHTVDPIQSVEELTGFLFADDLIPVEEVAYDDVTKALTYHITKEIPDIDTLIRTGNVDFGDQLRERTNLSGLNATGGASATVVVGDISLDITFGVLLVDDANTVGTQVSGTADSPSSATILTDVSAMFTTVPGLIGDFLENGTDRGTCTVTDVTCDDT